MSRVGLERAMQPQETHSASLDSIKKSVESAEEARRTPDTPGRSLDLIRQSMQILSLWSYAHCPRKKSP